MMPGMIGGPSAGPRIDPKKLDSAIELGLKRKELSERFINSLVDIQTAVYSALGAYRELEEMKLSELSRALSDMETLRGRLQSSIVIPVPRANA